MSKPSFVLRAEYSTFDSGRIEVLSTSPSIAVTTDVYNALALGLALAGAGGDYAASPATLQHPRTAHLPNGTTLTITLSKEA